MNLTFKKKRPLFYISFGFYAALSAFIIVESCLNSGLSDIQSTLFAKISAWFVNKTNEATPAELIKPTDIKLSFDSSYLGQDEQNISNIAIGTTTLATIQVTYPEEIKAQQTYDQAFTYESVLGNKDDYNVVLSSRTSNNLFYIDMRIVANEMTSPNYQINVNVAKTLNYSYKFHIVDLPAPTEYEAKLDKDHIKIGETTTVDIKLTGNDKKDDYLRRYFDQSKLNHSSNNEAVATIDAYGVIHGVSAGTATITYGSFTKTVTVSDEHIALPANSISLNISNKSTNTISLLDYDYAYDGEDDPNDYSLLIYPTFADPSLEDQSVRWETSNPLMGKIGPFEYDEETGYPLYHDRDGKYCARIMGYRKQGDVTITCYSNVDNAIKQTIDIHAGEAKASEFVVSVSKKDKIAVNEQIIVTATFSPKNTHQKALHVEPSNGNAQIINDNTTSVTIKAVKAGSCHFKVTSLSNDTLSYEFDMTFTAQEKINENNFSSFHAFVRKFAGHFFLFLVTAVFGMMFFYLFIEDFKKLWLSISLCVVSGVFLAGLSEFIQYFIPTRGGTIIDVGIDSLGYIIGAAITLGIILLVRFISKKHKEKKEQQVEEDK